MIRYHYYEGREPADSSLQSLALDAKRAVWLAMRTMSIPISFT